MKQTAVEWFSNQAYELFEQYSEGNFDRITLNKLMFEATNKAKEMEKEQMCEFADEFAIECINFHHEKTMSQEKFFDLTFNTNEK
jgi:hypothetical protein